MRFVKKETRRRKRRIGLEDAHQTGIRGIRLFISLGDRKPKRKKEKQGHIKCVYTINRQKECQHKRTQTSREEKRTKGYKKANRPQNLKQMATPKEMAQGNFVDSMPFHGDRTHQNLPTTRSHDAHTLISMAYRLKKKKFVLVVLYFTIGI